MYVCVCEAVTERQVREAVAEGVQTLRGLREQLGVTKTCGRCGRHARDVLRDCADCPRRGNPDGCPA